MASSSRVPICFSFLALILSASLYPFVAAEEEGASAAEEGPKHVLVLDSYNFTETVEKLDLVVVEFYAPWCGHCKKLEPEYEKAAAALSKHDPPIVLAKVDANDEANKGLASEYDVKGYPTIKVLRKGGKIVQEYKGPREADGIVEHLKKLAGPPSAEIKSAEDANTIIDKSKVFIVGVFSQLSGEEFENFIAVADKLRSDYDFGHTVEPKFLPKGETAIKPPLIRLLKPFDELFVDSKDFQVDAIEKFIEEASIPRVTIFDKDPSNHPYIMKFFDSANAKAMLFVNFSTENFEEFKSKYYDIAESYKGENISFLLGDLENSQGAFQYFGLREDQAPLIVVQTNDGQKYLKANVEPGYIASWLKEYMDGSVKPYIRSEPIPEDNNEPVKVVVADSLQDVVYKSGKNVLLEFYAPWCGHCQKLAPILDEVAISFESDSNVVIAKIDATANDFPPEFEVQGYPTVYFKSSTGKLLQYEGGRSKEDIIEFIQKNKDATDVQSDAQPDVQPDSVKDEL